MTNSRVLCTMPGRYGDILWSLATARAISETVGEPVDFMVSKQYGSIIGLISKQSYIGTATARESWEIREEAPITPRVPPDEPDVPNPHSLVVHLGYPGWPQGPTLPESIWKIAEEQLPGLKALELDRPWIQSGSPWIQSGKYNSIWGVAFGFSDEHFEVKVGLVELLGGQFGIPAVPVYAAGSRWDNEWKQGVKADWLQTAGLIENAKLFVGCLSSSWVLANAVGQRVVAIEPGEPRWNPLFWLESPRNVMVKGHDGRPTVDARHALAEIKKVLEGK